MRVPALRAASAAVAVVLLAAVALPAPADEPALFTACVGVLPNDDMMSVIPVDTIQPMPRVTNGTAVGAAQIQPVIDAAVKYGNVKHAFPAAEIIDPTIAK